MSLCTKTTALLAVIVFMVLVTMSLFWLHYQEDSLKHSIFQGVDGQARIAAHGIDAFVDDGLKDAQAISVMVPGQDLLQGRLDEVRSYFRMMFEIFPKFQNGIFILDGKGKFLVDYPPHPELQGQSFAFREYYQRTMKENHGIISKPYRSKRTGLPVLTFTAPIRSRGRIIAIVACSMDLISQEALGGYRKQQFWNTGYLYIFDRSHLLVLHPQDDRLLTNVEPRRNGLVEAALAGFEGVGESVNSQGVPMLVAIRKIPNTDWFVAVQVTQKEAYAPVTEARTRFIVVSSIAMLLVIALGAAVIRRVSLPLQQLEHAASQISTNLEDTQTNSGSDPAASALDSLNTIRSRDEIGLLAKSFLQLTIKLKHTLGSLRRSSEDWERTFDSVHEAVVTLDVDSRIMRINQIAETWFRTSRQKARGRYGYRVILGAEKNPLEWPDIVSLGKNQRIRWTQGLEMRAGVFEFVVTPITYAEETTGAVLVISDVTARVESEKQIHQMAFYDPVTGLPNRFLLQDRILHAIAAADRNKTMAVIMFIDLDRFKEVNDFYGHDAGDDVLRQVAGRIAACLRKNDTLSRIGGDEFVAVLQDVKDTSEVAAAAERIIELSSAPLILHGHELIMTASIGIAFFPEDGEDNETLLKNADTAMYRAKEQGRNNYQYFTRNLVS
jgi:diguanylate cyclase (GGDEF)-like protein